ncbi:MAG: HipA family kinase, partial [Planktothrix sp.]
MNSKLTHQQQREQWRDALESAIAHPEEPLLVKNFLKAWNTSARPALFRCYDNRKYMIKGQQAGRQMVNDQIVAKLGITINAPVGYPRIAEIVSDLSETYPELDYLTHGTAHATLFIEGCKDERDLTKFYTEQVENIPRFAS